MEFFPAEQNSRLAVSIVTYNTPSDELRALLRSVGAEVDGVVMTVVDNSPTDELRAVVEEAGALYLHPGFNVGFGAGHNVAIRLGLRRAPYQLVLNPDIVVGPGTIREALQFMDAHPEVGQLMPAVYYPDGSEQRLTKRLPTPFDLFVRRFLPVGQRWMPGLWQRYELRDVDLSRPCDVPSLSGCFMLVRSSVLEQVGSFDERYFMYMEDVDLCRRIGAVSQTVFHPEISVTHGYSKGSYRNLRLFRMHVGSAIRYFNKWGWFFDGQRRARNRVPGRLAVEATPAMAAAAELEMTAQ